MSDKAAPATAADVDSAALRIPCPTCRAPVWGRCTAGGFGYKQLKRPHIARRKAAQEARNAV